MMRLRSTFTAFAFFAFLLGFGGSKPASAVTEFTGTLSVSQSNIEPGQTEKVRISMKATGRVPNCELIVYIIFKNTEAVVKTYGLDFEPNITLGSSFDLPIPANMTLGTYKIKAVLKKPNGVVSGNLITSFNVVAPSE